MSTVPDIGRQEDTDVAVLERPDQPHDVVLWNDDVNLMATVIHALKRLFSYPTEKAEQLTLQVHNNGKAVVWSGARDRCVAYVQALHGYGLQATVGKSGGDL